MNAGTVWLVNKAKQSGVRWLSLVLLSSLLVITVYVFQGLSGLGFSLPFLTIILFSLFFNSLLLKTRWSLMWILIYNLPIALFVCVELLGKLFFSFPVSNLFIWLTDSNLLIFVWLERLNYWVWYFLQGTLLQETYGWPVFLLFQLWLITACLWLTYHKRVSVWWGVIIPSGLVGFWVQQEGLSPSFLLLALFCSFSLVAITFYQTQIKHWETTNLDYPTELWLEWAVSALLICILVLAAARSAPLITTPEGWQRINEWVDELRPRDNSAGVPSGPSQKNASDPSEDSPPERDLQPPNVNLVGTPLDQGDETVMRVRTSGSTSFHWRSKIYSFYTGYGWEEAPLSPLAVPQTKPLSGYTQFRQEFMLNGGYKGRLFAAGDPFLSQSEGVSIAGVAPFGEGMQDGTSFVVMGDDRHYQITSWVPDLNNLPDFSDRSPIPPDIAAIYLQVPDTLPGRVRTLAERLIQDPSNPFLAAVTVQNYLRGAIPYDLNTLPPPAGRDVVDYFLFEAPSGFCSYYATAMAVILRTQGIPARVVTGYANGELDSQTQIYRVPASSAHAWVEVYFTGYGWLPFEPTSSQNIPVYRNAEDMDQPTEQELSPQAWLNRRRLVFGLIGLLAVGFVTLIIWFIAKFMKQKKQFSRSSGHPAVQLYGQMIFLLHLAGVDYPAGSTPREFLRSNRWLAENYGRLWAGLSKVTSTYEQAIYSQHKPPLQEVRKLQKTIQLGLWDWVRLLVDHHWKGMRRGLHKRFRTSLR